MGRPPGGNKIWGGGTNRFGRHGAYHGSSGAIGMGTGQFQQGGCPARLTEGM